MIGVIWADLTKLFRLMNAPFRWLARKIAPKPADTDFFTKLGRTDFQSYEEARDWYQQMKNEMVVERIANMKGWERMTKRFVWGTVGIIAMNLAIYYFVPTFFGGTIQVAGIVFAIVIQERSLDLFIRARDGLLIDLEEDPETEAVWYDLWTKEWKHD